MNKLSCLLLLSFGLAGCFGAHDGDGGACGAQDARGEGACRALLGYKFDGDGCVSIGGCECVGADCDALFGSEAACLEACEVAPIDPPVPPPGGACAAQDIRGVGACRAVAGYAWDGAACQLIGCSCEGTDCDEIFATPEACAAAYATCAPPPVTPTCAPEVDGPVPVAPLCRPGAERAYFTADGCVLGCQCTEGAGYYGWPERCPPSYDDLAACAAAHAECPSTCAAQDAVGVGGCRGFFGVAWDGVECVGVGGCECVGNDCDRLYDSEEQCLSAHADCAPAMACAGEVTGPFEACTTGPDVWWFTDRGCEPGCECNDTPGGRCARSYPSIEQCLHAHPECAGGACGPGRISESLCRGLPRWVWSGTVCALTSACEGDLYTTESDCLSAHATCPNP